MWRQFCLLTGVFLLVEAGAAGAQQRLWREKSDDSLFLRIVFPAAGDTFDAGRVRFSGATDSAATVWVNGRTRRVYPSGAFVGTVSLSPGENLIAFAVMRGGHGPLLDTIRVYRRPPPAAMPQTPTAIDQASVEPKQDVSLSVSDELRVRFRGSPGGRANFEIKRIARDIPMVELRPEESAGLAGVYEGVFRLPATQGYKPENIRFKLQGFDRRKAKAESPGCLFVLPEGVPLVGITADTNNILRVAPSGAIFTELPMGIKLRVVGREGETLRVRLARDVEMYTSVANLRMLPVGSSLPTARVGAVSTTVLPEWVQLRIAMNERVPFRIEQFLDPQALEVTFFGAAQASEWTTYPASDSTVKIVRWRQAASDQCVLRVELNQRQQWGFAGDYSGNSFLLRIRREPRLAPPPASPFFGLTIAIDPGHGGAEPGAIGSTGLMEKDVNLRYAMMLADMLEARGASVVRTRTTDTTMTLRNRVEKARAAKAQLFLWLHNNSIGPAADPEAVRGTSTYYTVPHGLEISRKVYPHLLRLGLAPFGNIASTYYVTRQTDMLIFLVEGAFLSHPEDEMLLLDNSFLQKLAAAVVAGIESFLDDLRGAPATAAAPPTLPP